MSYPRECRVVGEGGQLKKCFFLSKKLILMSNKPALSLYHQGLGDLKKIVKKAKISPQKILLVSDHQIWRSCEKFFVWELLSEIAQIFLFDNPKADEKNLQRLLKISGDFDLIIALGSGTISDLCKLTSAQKNIPYIIIPSAPSMNGYLSKNASIEINGHKKTLPATLPIAVVGDVKILKTAPLDLIKAGIGDILCFYSCWFDWYLAHKTFGSKFSSEPFQILERKMKNFLNNFQKFSLDDERFLESLLEILLLSGWGMTIAGGSYPASQSEHMIAHLLNMKYPEKLQNYFHGNQIAVTTLTSAKLQEELLKRVSLQFKPSNFPKTDLEKFLGKTVARECEKEFGEKCLSADSVVRINKNLQKNWLKIRRELSKIHLNHQQLSTIFTHFKIKKTARSLGLSSQEYQACVANAKFIRNRFTVLDFDL
jgi:glycerol-1-phosphate dehydrogenase [NAD(P)+]